MPIRTFQPGDEAAQVQVYNEAAAGLPKFKPASVEEVRRRTKAADFDPETRFYAIEADQPVGYMAFQANGRVSFPWCRNGYEHCAAELCRTALQAMRARGLPLAFAAYRGDWPAQKDYFLSQGFRQAREMVNFVVDVADLPTPAASATQSVTPLRTEDVGGLFALAPQALRVRSAAELDRHLLHNPYFSADAIYVLHSRSPAQPILGAGVLVENPTYADPRQVDAAMPCFRLGAFGTEGMTTKRINGLFSFLMAPGTNVTSLALDLLGQAFFRLRNSDLGTLAAQVPSDVPHLLRFYQQFFQRQGSFPVFELAL
jgi:hypothetical protein